MSSGRPDWRSGGGGTGAGDWLPPATIQADLDMTDHKIINVLDPTADQDVATKKYVDDNAGAIPSGVILLWSGSIASIPATWTLCDGTLGTPDLRSRFVVGAGPSYAVGATGGEATHTLSLAEIPSHTHGVPLKSTTLWAVDCINAPGTHDLFTTVATDAAGGSGAHENRPPYLARAYIMRIS